MGRHASGQTGWRATRESRDRAAVEQTKLKTTNVFVEAQSALHSHRLRGVDRLEEEELCDNK